MRLRRNKDNNPAPTGIFWRYVTFEVFAGQRSIHWSEKTVNYYEDGCPLDPRSLTVEFEMKDDSAIPTHVELNGVPHKVTGISGTGKGDGPVIVEINLKL